MIKKLNVPKARGALLSALLLIVGLAAVSARWIHSDARTDSLFFISVFALIAAWAIITRLVTRKVPAHG
jgi:hypothetical protein